jgi:hypothetical protein
VTGLIGIFFREVGQEMQIAAEVVGHRARSAFLFEEWQVLPLYLRHRSSPWY